VIAQLNAQSASDKKATTMADRPGLKHLLTRLYSSRKWSTVLSTVWLFILLGLAVYLELPHETLSQDNPCELLERAGTETSAVTYGYIVSSGYRNVRCRRVTVVPLSDETDPAKVLNNVCEQRFYIANLVDRLSALGASAIVIDKYFGVDSCSKNDKGTTDLINAVRASKAPVVVGVATHPPRLAHADSCLIATPSLDFGLKTGPNSLMSSEPAAIQGLTRLNADVRKVPLNWFVYKSDKSFSDGEAPADSIETLSYTAATLADSHLKDDRGVKYLRSLGQHPFTSFIDPDAIPRADASSVLCSGPHRQQIQMESRYSVDCGKYHLQESDIRGRVIVIGDDSTERDRHRLFDRDVPGVYLQANYIESLLDGRYFKPLPRSWDFGLFLGWLVFLYVIFWAPIPPFKSLIISVLVGLSIFAGILLLAFWKGFYPDLGVQILGVVALIVRYVEVRGHQLAEVIVHHSTAKAA
jgi:CHASE2 domain-containing sensor protein